ncbi:MAG: hypothetical protein FJZ00_12315, partial [Candidatus Sericytochromatia bacterium]|nr:hypothetical protein [Candidatus Tanganyikabacteria bacterium]
MRYKILAISLFSMTLLAGCGTGSPGLTGQTPKAGTATAKNWPDPDTELRDRLALLKREYDKGTYGWRDYNDARISAILRAWGAGTRLRLSSLAAVYEDGGVAWATYNKHRMDVLTQAYGDPLADRLAMLAEIYQDGGITWTTYNQTRIGMIEKAYGERLS